jgi:hypothetical protein
MAPASKKPTVVGGRIQPGALEMPVKAVLRNMACFALHFRPQWKAKPVATKADVQELVNRMRSVADRFPFGGSYANELRELAARIQIVEDTVTRQSTKPKTGRAELREYQFNQLLWAMDRIRRAVKSPADKFWNAYICGPLSTLFPDDAAAMIDPENIRDRIRRFERTLKPGMVDRAFALAVTDAVASGPELADGARRQATR